MTMSRNRIRLSLVLAFALAVSVAMAMPPIVQPVRAATVTVGPTGDFTTLTAAVNSLDGDGVDDVINVQPGAYSGSLFVTGDAGTPGEQLVIEAITPGTVTITTGSSDPVITVGGVAGEPSVVLVGVEITGGDAEIGGGVWVRTDGSVELIDSVVTGNTASGGGGGIATDGVLTLTRTTVTANTNPASSFGSGGGISAGSGAIATLVESVVSANTSDFDGGGIYVGDGADVTLVDTWVYDNVAPSLGGGVHTNGTLTIDQSTVSANTSTQGGGVYAATEGIVTIEDSTISGNTGTFRAGGIGVDGIEFFGGTVDLRNVTITQNVADTGGGFVVLGGGISFTLRNTIVAENVGNVADADCFGTPTSAGHNLIGIADSPGCDFTGTTGDLSGTQAGPLLPEIDDFLTFNGGATPTHYPDVDSIVIDAGDNTGLDGLFDQTGGTSRTLDGDLDTIGVTDIGAIEFVPLFSIQAAVDAAADGATIDVPGGSYFESVIIDDKNLTLNGIGGVVIDNDQEEQPVLSIVGTSDVTINNVTLTGGELSGLYILGASAAATLNDVFIEGNANFSTGNGGGVINEGTLVMNGGSISFNQASEPLDGGGLYNTGTATLVGVIVEGNTVGNPGDGGRGGGIFNSGTLTVTGGSVVGGDALPGSGHTADNGGGIYNAGTLTVSNSTISNNDADDLAGFGAGGGIYTTSLATLSGAVLDGNSSTSGGGIYNEGTLDIESETVLRNNLAYQTEGGGVGGGLYSSLGPVDIANATFVDNVAEGSGGAVYSNSDGVGISGSTFDSNTARFGGGALFLAGDSGTTISGATFWKNRSPLGDGGAIEAIDRHQLTITGSSFERNGAGLDGGAIESDDGATVSGTSFIGNTSGYPLFQGGNGGAISVFADGSFIDVDGSSFTRNGAGAERSDVVTPDQVVTGPSGSTASCGGTGPLFQGFTPTASTLDRVLLKMRGFSSRGGDTLHIALRSGGPQGDIVAEADGYVPGGLPVGSVEQIQFVFANAVELIPGDLYVIELSDFENWSWYYESGNPYLGGDAWAGCGGGVPLLDADTDYHIQTESAPTFESHQGGAIYMAADGTSTVDLASNSTDYVGNDAGRGGAISHSGYDGGVLSVGDVFDANRATTVGGAVALFPNLGFSDFIGADFTGNTAVTGGAVYVTAASGAQVSIGTSALSGNAAVGDGGAVWSASNLFIGSSAFVGNTAGGDGGAIRVNQADLNVFDNESGPNLFNANASRGDGGAISATGLENPHFISDTLFESNTTGYEDGTLIYVGNGGALHTTLTFTSIERSAFVGNSALNGGAIYPSGATDAASISVQNVTLTENFADGAGGAIWADLSAVVNADSVTIADNSATRGGGIFGSGSINLQNTILALNDAQTGPDCFGTGAEDVTSFGYNLIGEDTDCDFVPDVGDLVGDAFAPLDPLLDPIADNGGQTPTMAIAEGSPVIDAGDTQLSEDQRGFERPYLGIVADIGAFESEFAPSIASVQVFIDGGDSTPVGASSVPIENIPSSALTNTNPDVIAGTPVGDVDVEATPINSIPVGSIPVASIPVASIGPALDSILLIDVPIEGGWESVLAGTSLDGPVHLYTLGDALDSADVLAVLEARGIDFGALTLAATPVASIPISSIVLGATPINSIPISSIEPGTEEHFAAWCLALGFGTGTSADLVACRAALGLPADATAFAADESVLSLALRSTPVNSIPVNSIPVSSIPINSIPINSIPVASIPVSSIYVAGTPINSILLTDTPINSIPINSIPVNSIDLAGTPVGSIPVNSIPVGSIELLFDCAATDCISSTPIGSIDPSEFLVETYGQLLQVLFDAGLLGGFTVADVLEGLPDNATVADLIAFLIPPEEYPWQQVDLDASELATFASPPEVTNFSGDVALFDVFEPTDLVLEVTLPPGFIYVPGSAQFDLGTETFEPIEPDVFGDLLVWQLSGQEFDVFFEFSAVSSLTVGPTGVLASAFLPANGTSDTQGDDLTVTEAFPNNDSPVAAVSLQTDTIYLSHIGSSDEGDFFLLPGVLAGSIINLSLSNLDVDLDLVLYGPDAPPLRGDPERRVNSVTDTGLDALEAGAGDPGSANDIPLEADRDVVAISAQRGAADESIVTDPVAVGGDYVVQVTGYNGATSRDPYTLLPQVAPPAGADACASVPPVLGTQGQLPAGPLAASVNTLFLVHRGLLEAVYPADAAAILAALDGFSDLGDLGVEAAVIEVDGDAAVQAATQTWVSSATAYCSIDNANAVASVIASVVDSYRATNPGIEYVVFVGGDDQVPSFRLPDATEIANESGYGTGLGGLITPQTAALSAGFLLSDEPYGDPNPLLTQDGREIYVSEVALGRLVESGPDILQTLANFAIFNGLLDPSTTSSAFVSGYDFLIDGAEAVEDELNDAIVDDVSGATRSVFAGLISDVWTAADLTSDLLAQAYTVVSFNAHFDHQRAEPADLSTGGGLIEADDLDDGSDPFLRDIVFSMGCHSGFQASDFQVGDGGTGQTLPIADDWAQTIARQGGTFIGNTGYGYGDTDVVALSETLMTNFAGNLDGPVTVGKALNLAKHQYIAGGLTYGPYDDKVVHIATFYGLPFYKVGGLGDAAALADPIDTSVDGTTGLIAADVDTADLAGQLQLRTGSRGQYYAFAEPGSRDRTQASPYRPIQPRIEVDVTQGGGLVARGALITGLSSQDFAGFDPSVSRPVIELGSNEPEPVRPGIFPSVIQAVNRYLSATGLRDQLVLVPGQFRSDETDPTTGIQRIFTDIEAKVFYSDESDLDFDPPIIRRATGTDLTGAVNFEIVTDPTDVVQVLVLYKVQGTDGAWSTVQLSNQGAGIWTGSAPAAGLLEFYAQAVDGAGNVGVNPNKGALHVADNDPPVPPAASEIIANVSGTPVGGWYPDPVTVTLNQAFGILEYQLDGGGLTPYNPATGIPVAGEGVHELSIFSSGLVEEITIQVDGTGPSITSPIDGATYLQNELVPVMVDCADGGSGVASCTPNGGTLDTSTVGNFSFTAAASDVVGNSSSKAIAYSVSAAPAAVINENVDTVPEGTGVAFTATTDATSPLYSWTAARSGTVVATGASATFAFVADDDGVYEVTLIVGQDGVDSEPAVETFTVTNVAPQIDAMGDATVELGAEYVLEIGPVTDPGDDSAFEFVVEWGDGTSDTVDTLGPLNHTYDTLGLKNIAIHVTDEDGTFVDAGSANVTVEGTPTTITVDAVSVTVHEGDTAVNTGAFGGTDPVEVSVIAGPGDVVQNDADGTWEWTFDTIDGPSGPTLVTLQSDGAAGIATVNFNLTVLNVDPTADLDGDATVDVDAAYTVTIGDVVDPGDDTVTAWSIDWGDGDSDSFAAAPGTADHTYDSAGPRTVVLSLTDEDGTFDVASLDVMVEAVGAAVCDTAVPTIEGTSGRDIIFGTSGADVIFAGGGNDVVYGLGGDDIICAGDGNDRVHADGGNDFVDGGRGNDRLFGGTGDDELVGGDGNDRMYGQGGNDLLEGGAGNDRLNGGSGTDTVTYENAANGIWASLTSRYATGDGFDRIYAENLIGSEYDDTLIGKASKNWISGLGGDDDIEGRAGEDTLDGGPGTDSLNGGFGQDTCLNGESLTSCEL